jgi:uncharacterized surface protein with fasciclin (FAS1) repeats
MGIMRKELVFLILGLCIAGVLIAGCTTPTTTPPATTVKTTPVPTTAAPVQTTAPPANTIVSTAIANGNFTTLVAALQAAKLDSVLSGPGPYTVFAPTDAAFKNLPNGTLQKLLLDPSGQLTDILKYHVVSGKILASDLANKTTVTTLNGAVLKVNVTNNTVYVNGAKIVKTDITTANGVIQVIDAVLIPPTPVSNNTTSANLSSIKTAIVNKTGM